MSWRPAPQLLKVFLYYLLLFALCRIAFLFYFIKEVTETGGEYFFLSLWKALPLDISAAAYLLFIPLILLTLQVLWPRHFFSRLLKIYMLGTTFLIAFLSIAEIGVYREVHVKIYFNLLTHLKRADELLLSVSWPLLITLLALFGLVYYAANRFFNLYIANKNQPLAKPTPRIASSLFIFLLTIPILAIACRGGLQPIPINEGEVYFSHSQCVNDATVNPSWNLVHSYIETRKVLRGGTYRVMDDAEARQLVQQLYAVPRDTTTPLFKSSRPNVCILILESWSAMVIESLGGYHGLTPNFEKLVNEGYLFTQAEATGHVSDQGVPGVLSAYPALTIGSAINQPGIHAELPAICHEVKGAGYSSSFFFGGQLIFGGIKSYIYQSGFDKVVEHADLPSSTPAGMLGVHDSIMLGIWRQEIGQMKKPCFSCLFTTSTHSPYDAVDKNLVNWGTMEDKYLSTVIYADRQLGRFFSEAKKQPWYDSTIFILVADHSRSTPKNFEYCSPEFYHIPLLITGGALREEFRGHRFEQTASQLDIASTLLHQLGLNSSAYPWSKNLANPYTRPFAFYTFDEGFGMVEPGRQVVWNKKFPSTNRNTANTPAEKAALHQRGAAMLQVLMEDFLRK